VDHLLFGQVLVHVDVEMLAEVFNGQLGVSNIHAIDGDPVEKESWPFNIGSNGTCSNKCNSCKNMQLKVM
jgi:hypothetical protein